jgi:hypothetical protein
LKSFTSNNSLNLYLIEWNRIFINYLIEIFFFICFTIFHIITITSLAKSPRNFWKHSPSHYKKSFNFSENVFKNNRNLLKSLKFSENIFKMPRILKNSSHSQKKLRILKKKPLIFKKKPGGNCHIATMASLPLVAKLYRLW